MAPETMLGHSTDVELQKGRHIKYWLRCLKTLLPSQYTGNDSQRMTLAFFTLSAIDLLSRLEDHTTAAERQGYVDWIYRCQHPKGGFKGFTGADGGGPADNCWDPANLAATFFALASLIILGDPMDRVDTQACVLWLRSLQQPDGSFGEALGRHGVIEGGRDIRYCYLAAAVRWILRRKDRRSAVQDFNVESLVDFVRQSVTYEGGIAQAPLHEAHAGWTYCGIGALVLLERWPGSTSPSPEAESSLGLDRQNMLHWLLSRQTEYIIEAKDSQDEDETDVALQPGNTGFVKLNSYAAASAPMDSTHDVQVSAENGCAGYNGRCNKVADTCYAFWVGGSLAMIESLHLQNNQAIRSYLLERTQHLIGGFGKLVGDVPDILHSYLGLAALSLMEDPSINAIDASLCITMRAKANFETRTSSRTRLP